MRQVILTENYTCSVFLHPSYAGGAVSILLLVATSLFTCAAMTAAVCRIVDGLISMTASSWASDTGPTAGTGMLWGDSDD